MIGKRLPDVPWYQLAGVRNEIARLVMLMAQFLIAEIFALGGHAGDEPKRQYFRRL